MTFKKNLNFLLFSFEGGRLLLCQVSLYATVSSCREPLLFLKQKKKEKLCVTDEKETEKHIFVDGWKSYIVSTTSRQTLTLVAAGRRKKKRRRRIIRIRRFHSVSLVTTLGGSYKKKEVKNKTKREIEVETNISLCCNPPPFMGLCMATSNSISRSYFPCVCVCVPSRRDQFHLTKDGMRRDIPPVDRLQNHTNQQRLYHGPKQWCPSNYLKINIFLLWVFFFYFPILTRTIK